jgi:hypothetical protein
MHACHDFFQRDIFQETEKWSFEQASQRARDRENVIEEPINDRIVPLIRDRSIAHG